MNWLDTQTQDLLQGEPPQRLAPPKVAEYGVVLLQKGIDQQREILSNLVDEGRGAAGAS